MPVSPPPSNEALRNAVHHRVPGVAGRGLTVAVGEAGRAQIMA
jgi:hypothetical protein